MASNGFSISWSIKLPDPSKTTSMDTSFLYRTGMRCYDESRKRAQLDHADSLGRKLPLYSEAYKRRKMLAGKSGIPDFTWSGKAWSLTSQNISIFSKRLDKARLRNSFRGSWAMPKGIVGGKARATKELAKAAADLRQSLGRDLTGSEYHGLRRQFMIKKEPAARAKAWAYVSRHDGVYLLGYGPGLVETILREWRAIMVDKGNNGAKVTI